MKQQVGIIGAGPAGLTAAYELVQDDRFQPVLFESDVQVGGISKTIHYHGNRMDLGGHRFFTKVDRVSTLWEKILPLATAVQSEKVMLQRHRLSRILFGGDYYDYPVSPTVATLKNLGMRRLSKIAIAYMRAVWQPIQPEKNLEDFLINRFGRELYQTFFEKYTEKVWGVPCCDIPNNWGQQRVKGLSIAKALQHILKKYLNSATPNMTETSLIESFHYPKYGPGQFWDEAAAKVISLGGQLHTETKVVGLSLDSENRITELKIQQGDKGIRSCSVDAVISSMPIKDLVDIIPNVPKSIRTIAHKLPYRDFITIGMLIAKNEKLKQLQDNWIYIQEPHLRAGRIQIFNNWSPALVADPTKLWLGLEYFCQDTDSFWNSSNEKLVKLAESELKQMGYIESDADVFDATVIRVPKAYPAYFGSYEKFPEVQEYFKQYPNLYLVGRNGMHRYNNMDHSMLTAMYAADLIKGMVADKAKLWELNTEQEYHESK